MLLAALPATPVQLAHACYRFGFEVVAPASWGDELVAHAVLEDLRHRNRDPVIQCTCPLVAERLLANGQHLVASMVQTASPPVAAARYARHAFSPRAIRVTYIGACPGAVDVAIDERFLPDEFMHSLIERDIALADMPSVFDSVLPPDRRRFESLPGGCPTQESLWQSSDGRMLREVTQPTFSTDLAQTLVWREYVLVDVAPSLGCPCAGGYSRLGTRCGRVAVTALEPPRAMQPVVAYQPEYAAATIEEPVAPVHNEEAVQAVPEPKEASPVTRTDVPADGGANAGRVRVRTPSPLPRAYLAKRRHLPQSPRGDSPQGQDVSPEPSLGAERPDAVAEPNEPDIARPIAMHVEPEAAPLEPLSEQPPTRGEPPNVEISTDVTPPPAMQPPDVAPSSRTAATSIHAVDVPIAAHAVDIPIAADVQPPSQGAVPETETISHGAPAPSTTDAVPFTVEREMQDELDTDVWGPPVAVAPEEEEPFEPTSGPLRVEVEIVEEAAPAPPVIVIPDEILQRKPLRPSRDVAQAVTPPPRNWGDLLIALWLVLVASAVIASLVWRR